MTSLTYTYTFQGQLSTVTAPGTKVWDLDYNDMGQVTLALLPNGMATAYDTRDRMSKNRHHDSFLSPAGHGWRCGLLSGLRWIGASG